MNNSLDMNWNFNHEIAPEANQTDFYTIVLHEIGHSLGLSSGFWHDWESQKNGSGEFTGKNAVAALNADTGAEVETLALDSSQHWARGTYKSSIFPGAKANYVGTVGPRGLQRLLMEPFLPNGVRTEATNVEVGGLADIGWSVVEAEEIIDPVVIIPEVAQDLQVSRSAEGVVQLVWTSQVGASYTVQVGEDLKTWSSVLLPVVAISTQTVWVDTDASTGQKFYRVITNQ